jgi:citrate synthase
MAARNKKGLTSRMGWNTESSIIVNGVDLCQDILGKMSLAEMAWLEITGTKATQQQSNVLNALLVSLVEHGMTPMALVTRLTYLCAPESVQAAVAAGLCGVGTTYAGTSEGAAKIVQTANSGPDRDRPVADVARDIVREHLSNKRTIPGIGHGIHRPIDPRVPILFRIAAENGLSGRHVELINAISVAASEATGKNLPVNVTGAIGAIASELGLDWQMCRGISVIARCVGLVGHLAEEIRNPIANEVYQRSDEEVTENAIALMVEPS